jgi:organic hydroperoxide reductase OsmC/OhrA
MNGVWSPEELLVAAAATCFTVTLAAVSERSGVDLRSIDVHGVGHLERRTDGRFAFTVIELAVEVEAQEHPYAVERLVADAEKLCIVTLALDVPVHVRLVAVEPVGVAISG